MKILTQLMISAIFLVSSPVTVVAQTADDFHPFLSDKFNMNIGLFWPKIEFNAAVDGSDPSDEIDFDEALNLNDYQTTPAIDFRWRFGKKWSLGGQYWTTDTSGKEVLTQDVKWEDIVFKEGTFVGGGVGLDVVRVFVGRKFTDTPNHEFGVGAGLHYLKLSTYMEGEVITENLSVEFERVNASADFPLPNIGGWYLYSWSPKWMLQARIDWLSASIGDYSGSLWDAQIGVNYQAFKNIGFGLSYIGFVLDVDIDKGDWHGKAKMKQAGPMLAMTVTW